MTTPHTKDTTYKKVFDPIAEGNPAPIVNPDGAIMDCLECGYAVSSLDGLCTDCWYYRHDARLNADGTWDHDRTATANYPLSKNLTEIRPND